MNEVLAEAWQQLEIVKQMVAATGQTFVELDPSPVGVGLALAWSDSQFIVLSIQGGGNEQQLFLTSGVLRDIGPIGEPCLAALMACNRKTADNSAFPFYINELRGLEAIGHEVSPEAGQDVLIQQRYPLQLLIDVPPFFEYCISRESLPAETDRARNEFAATSEIGGTPFSWNPEDVTRLLNRSLL